MRTTRWVATHTPRKTAPYVSDTFDSRWDSWMKIAANPAATSSDAGTSASSSRLRALMSRPSLDLTALERDHEVLGVVLGSQLVVGERLAPVGRDVIDGHARAGVTGVELDPGRQVVRQPPEDRDRAVVARV